MVETTVRVGNRQLKVAACEGCHDERPIYNPATGRCKACYERLRREASRSTCPGCGGHNKRLVAKGLCGRCYGSPRRHDFEARRRTRPLTPGEIALANEKEGLFVGHFLPAVRRKATWSFRAVNWQERQELVAECSSVAWQEFCRLVGRSKVPDPLRLVAAVAKWSVRNVRSWRYLAGNVSRDDAMSRRLEVTEGVRPAGGDAPSRFGSTVWELVGRWDEDGTYMEWVNSLPCRERRFVELVMEGNDVLEAKDALGMELREMTELIDGWWDSWKAYARR